MLSEQFLKARFQANQDLAAILQLFIEYLDENRTTCRCGIPCFKKRLPLILI
jgi:hypothetical protein